jgi:hypothetical protein
MKAPPRRELGGAGAWTREVTTYPHAPAGCPAIFALQCGRGYDIKAPRGRGRAPTAGRCARWGWGAKFLARRLLKHARYRIVPIPMPSTKKDPADEGGANGARKVWGPRSARLSDGRMRALESPADRRAPKVPSIWS